MNASQFCSRALRIACVGSLALAACTESPTSVEPGPTVRPTVGSIYTYRSYRTDSTGKEVPGSSNTVTARVLATGQSYRSRSDLTVIEEKAFELYVHYGADGDIAIFPSVPDTTTSVEWIELPFGSRRTIVAPPVSTSVGTTTITTTSNTSFVSVEVIETSGGPLVAQRIKITQSLTVSIGGSKQTSTVTSNMWYAPSIGYLAKITSDFQTDGSSGGGKVQVLESFERK